ncbi:MAG: hypothetical protein ABIR47_15485 [Candidatus Kapaibacterium sp.]
MIKPRIPIRALLYLSSALIAAGSIAGCAKDSTPTGTDNPTPVALTGKHYVQATIDGKVITQQEQPNSTSLLDLYGQGFSEHSGGASDGKSYLVTQIHAINHSSFVSNQLIPDTAFHPITIEFIYLFPHQPYSSDYDMMIIQGELMTFGSEAKEKRGVEIAWTDATGTKWSTALGSGDQTGSQFLIAEHTKGTAQGGFTSPHYETKGTFNATLYDKTGKSMKITNGKFSLQTVFY